jgi:hypothetical protein
MIEAIDLLVKLWPVLLGFIILIVTLAQSHYRIKVLEEKVKTLFDLVNQWRK